MFFLFFFRFGCFGCNPSWKQVTTGTWGFFGVDFVELIVNGRGDVFLLQCKYGQRCRFSVLIQIFTDVFYVPGRGLPGVKHSPGVHSVINPFLFPLLCTMKAGNSVWEFLIWHMQWLIWLPNFFLCLDEAICTIICFMSFHFVIFTDYFSSRGVALCPTGFFWGGLKQPFPWSMLPVCKPWPPDTINSISFEKVWWLGHISSPNYHVSGTWRLKHDEGTCRLKNDEPSWHFPMMVDRADNFTWLPLSFGSHADRWNSQVVRPGCCLHFVL